MKNRINKSLFLFIVVILTTDLAQAQSFWVTGQGANDYWGITAESSKISTLRGVGMSTDNGNVFHYSIGESHLLTSSILAGINLMQDKNALGSYGLSEGVQTNLLEYRRGLGASIMKPLAVAFGANIEIGSMVVGKNETEGVLPMGPELAVVWGPENYEMTIAVLYTAQAMIGQEEKSLFGENSNQAIDIYASRLMGDRLRLLAGVHYEAYNLGPNFTHASGKNYSTLSFSAGIGF